MRAIKPVLAALIVFAALALPHAVAQEPVTITLWTHDQLYIDYFLERSAEWEQRHPEYEITYDFQQMPDPLTAALTAISARQPLPDLLGIEIGEMPGYMQGGAIARYFVDLSDRITDRRDEFIEGRLSPYMYEGGLYGLESALTASVYYYQPALFEEHGVDVPTTWEEFLQAGEIMGEHGVAMTVASNDSQGAFHMLLLQRGATVFDESGDFVLGEEPNRSIALEVLEYMRAGIDNGTFYTVTSAEFWGPTLPTAFSQGRVAGIVMPDWYAGCCLQPGVADMAGEWRVAPIPVWEAGGYSTTTWGGTGFAIAADSPIVELVWDLLEDAYGTLDGQLARYESIGFYPTMYEALAHPRVTEISHPFFGGQQIGQVFSGVALDVPPLFQSPNRGFFLTALGDNLPLFFDGDYTPEQFLDAVISITEDEILFAD